MGKNKDRIADAVEELVDSNDAEASADSAGAAAAAQLINALVSHTAGGRTTRTEGRITDDTRSLATRDSAEQKTSDIGLEERAALENFTQQMLGFGNNKAISDVGSTLTFDRSITALQGINPFSVIMARMLSDGASHSAALNHLVIEAGKDAAVVKHMANLESLTVRNDLAELNATRGIQRDESAIARGGQRDQDALSAVMVRLMDSVNPIIIERLRDNQDFRAIVIDALGKALSGAAAGGGKKK